MAALEFRVQVVLNMSSVCKAVVHIPQETMGIAERHASHFFQLVSETHKARGLLTAVEISMETSEALPCRHPSLTFSPRI